MITRKLRCQSRQAIVLALCPPIFDYNVLPFDETVRAHSFTESRHEVHRVVSTPAAHKTDLWHCPLCPREPRPWHGCYDATDSGNKRTPSHSIALVRNRAGGFDHRWEPAARGLDGPS